MTASRLARRQSARDTITASSLKPKHIPHVGNSTRFFEFGKGCDASDFQSRLRQGCPSSKVPRRASSTSLSGHHDKDIQSSLTIKFEPLPGIQLLKLPEGAIAPEPGTLALLGLGLAGIGYRRYKAS
jgi:hypothetical protein